MGNKPPVVKFKEVRAYISKPVKPLVKTFYEKHIKDEEILRQGYEQGKLVKGRIYFDVNGDKSIGFVKADSIDLPIKVWGLRNLNRALHMDEVYLRLV